MSNPLAEFPAEDFIRDFRAAGGRIGIAHGGIFQVYGDAGGGRGHTSIGCAPTQTIASAFDGRSKMKWPLSAPTSSSGFIYTDADRRRPGHARGGFALSLGLPPGRVSCALQQARAATDFRRPRALAPPVPPRLGGAFASRRPSRRLGGRFCCLVASSELCSALWTGRL
jgi:hypothetical protein